MWCKCASGDLVNLSLAREVRVVEVAVTPGAFAFFADNDGVPLFEGGAQTCRRIQRALEADLSKGAALFDVNSVLELSA